MARGAFELSFLGKIAVGGFGNRHYFRWAVWKAPLLAPASPSAWRTWVGNSALRTRTPQRGIPTIAFENERFTIGCAQITLRACIIHRSRSSRRSPGSF